MSSLTNISQSGALTELVGLQRGTQPLAARVESPVSQSSNDQRLAEVADLSAVVAKAAEARADVNIAEVTAPTREVVQAAAQALQSYLSESGRSLSVSVDGSTGYYVTKVVNPDTGELIRQMPSAELLRIARNFDRLQGVLVNQTV